MGNLLAEKVSFPSPSASLKISKLGSAKQTHVSLVMQLRNHILHAKYNVGHATEYLNPDNGI